TLADTTLGDALLAPTRIYIKPVLDLIRECSVHALAHITGGGLLENIPRVLPKGTVAVLDAKAWEMPPVFHWPQRAGNAGGMDMSGTFSCACGRVACAPAKDAATALACRGQAGEAAPVIGRTDSGNAEQPTVVINCALWAPAG